jgi:hypothetical protein
VSMDNELESMARLIVSRMSSDDPEDDPKTTAIVYAILLAAKYIADACLKTRPHASITIDPAKDWKP